MRPAIRSALNRAAELTRENRLVDAMRIGEAAINRATDAEISEIQQWLIVHTPDFIRDGD
jgi:hypothetical protein